VARLYGCDVANASMYDGSTACWEAIGMARRITRRSKAISRRAPPALCLVAKTMAKFTGDTLDTAPPTDRRDRRRRLIARSTARPAASSSNIPTSSAGSPTLADRRAAHAQGALLIAVVTEPVALGAIKSPGEMGADIVVGEGQSIGVGLQFGGPYVGLFACREKYVRQMPGRLPARRSTPRASAASC
jgi:glycine dehydrogenase subunit 1